VDENLCKASDLYSKSAGRGNPDAMFSLAIFHQEGLGGNINFIFGTIFVHFNIIYKSVFNIYYDRLRGRGVRVDDF
jgi:hypothetical protein